MTMKRQLKRLLSGLAAGVILLGSLPAHSVQKAAAYSVLPINSANYDIDSDVTNIIAAKMNVDASEISPTAGVTVSYSVYMLANEKFNSARVALKYPIELAVKSAVYGKSWSDMSPQISMVEDSSNAEGRVTIELSSEKNVTPPSEAAELMRVEFQIPANVSAPKTYTMKLQMQQFLNAAKEPLSYYQSDGTITISGNPPAVQTCTVKFSANGGSGTMSDITANRGSGVTLPECSFTPPSGTAFTGWQIGRTTYQPGDSVTFTEDTTVSAVWSQIMRVITFSANGGSGSIAPVTVAEGSSLTLPPCTFTAPAGSSFSGWQIGSTVYQPGERITVAGNMTASAVWTKNQYSVSFDANGGSGSMKSAAVSDGSTYTLPASTFTAPVGMSFSGWKIGSTTYQPGDSITVSGNTTVTAVWSQNIHSITFYANGGSGSMEGAQAAYGSSYTLPLCTFTAPSGKNFAGWQINGTVYQPGERITVTGDTAAAAVWTTIVHTVTFYADRNSSTTSTLTISDNDTLTFPQCSFPAPSGMVFIGWQVGDATYRPGETLKVTGDLSATAVWTKIVRIISFDAAGGSGTMQSVTAADGEPYRLPENGFGTPEGYSFAGWIIGGRLYRPGDSITVSSDLTISASWVQAKMHTIIYDANDGSGATAQEQIADQGTLTLPDCMFPIPDSQIFAGWLFNGTLAQPGEKTPVTKDMSVQAFWILRGDTDLSGEVKAVDAQNALQAYVRKLAGKDDGLNAMQRCAADLDRDGSVSAKDAQIILQYYVHRLAGKTTTWSSLLA